ncbi:MAG: hypothetical protein AMXMBFR64_38630 [Myxococcales bacterium]
MREVTEQTRERWAQDFAERAAAWWTPERTRAQLGTKRLVLPPATSGPLLRALGLLNRDASMPPDRVRKYLQISHMIALLEPVFVDLARHPVVRVLDAGCGASYLTLLLGWCFAHRWRHPAQIVGVDRNPEVIERCRRSASMALLDGVVRFEVGSLEGLEVPSIWERAFGDATGGLHALVALHACDTASDDALALGVAEGADFIGVAPCCQAELARRWAELSERGMPGPLAPLWASSHLRREAGATLTNALRALLLRARGYDVTAMEFVPTAHTPKNTLLRAVLGGTGGLEEYLALRDALGGVSLHLERALRARHCYVPGL